MHCSNKSSHEKFYRVQSVALFQYLGNQLSNDLELCSARFRGIPILSPGLDQGKCMQNPLSLHGIFFRLQVLLNCFKDIRCLAPLWPINPHKSVQ